MSTLRRGGGQPVVWDQSAVFGSLDLFGSLPESDDLWYKSGDSKKTIWSHSEDWWLQGGEAVVTYLTHDLQATLFRVEG